MIYSVRYESINRQKMADAGNANEYMFLIGKNKTLFKHFVAINIYDQCGKTIPDEFWEDLMKSPAEYYELNKKED